MINLCFLSQLCDHGKSKLDCRNIEKKYNDTRRWNMKLITIFIRVVYVHMDIFIKILFIIYKVMMYQ